MLQLIKDVLLVLNVIYMLRFDYFSFLHGLNSILLILLVFMPRNTDVTERTYNGLVSLCSLKRPHLNQ